MTLKTFQVIPKCVKSVKSAAWHPVPEKILFVFILLVRRVRKENLFLKWHV